MNLYLVSQNTMEKKMNKKEVPMFKNIVLYLVSQNTMEKKMNKKEVHMFKNIVNDALYNCSTDCAKNDDQAMYGRGVLVGLVSGLMARNNIFDDAIKNLSICFSSTSPFFINKRCIPDCWLETFIKYFGDYIK